jgi:hypothetical protein
MSDSFAPPPGPPPPKVPEGWKAVWNEQYKEWFYVNIYTKASQWDKPTQPVYPPGESAPPAGAPPSYNNDSGVKSSDAKVNPFDTTDEDARYAAQLQAEEDARARAQSQGGGQAGYYGQHGGSSPYPQQQQYVDQSKSKGKSGLLSKILGAASKPRPGHMPPAASGYGGYGHQPGYGGYGQPGYGAPYGQPGYGPPMGGGYGGGFGGGGRRQGGGGMGMAAPMAMGLGAGVLGGVLVGEAMENHNEQEGYQEGYQDGQQDDGGGGGDFGGGDFDGGDMGGGDF